MRFGAIVAIVQALVAIVVGFYLIYKDLTDDGSGETLVSEAAAADWIGTGTAIFIFIIFGTVAAGAFSLLQGKNWGRTPIIMLEIILIPISGYMVTEGLTAIGIAVLLSAILALVGLFHPQTSEWLSGQYERNRAGKKY